VYLSQKISPGPGCDRPSETQEKPHFQSHSLPFPDFWSAAISAIL